MNNSKWRANRIGLVDFWYYDEEEFQFLDGRMLLRGANGSGKSVTMQSFIPVILDGNIQPKRLDPFGSTARKMENYLLEEGDGREERTGYLYMEFKREDVDAYFTIGIGMRARVNKRMDIWYFAITDNRRIGRDFFLYKDVKNKITYTKAELKNRISEGGRVFESQREYMEYVNKTLFGFETIDEYREMLKLLIQLRTPKLSKDFKPTVINEILSSSLQTLTEDDLRPISEAIENMDSLKTNLDMLKESLQSGKQIERVYNQYNQVVMYNKASFYINILEKYNLCEHTTTTLEKQKIEKEEQLKREEKRYETLQEEESVLTKEKESFSKSEAASLKEKEQAYIAEYNEYEIQKQKKEKQYEEKKEKRTTLEDKIKEQRQNNESYQENMIEQLEEMEELIGEIPFDDFAFLKKEIVENLDTHYNFDSHRQLLMAYSDHVEQGVKILEQERKYQEKYNDSLQQYDEIQKERDDIEKNLKQYENLLYETKSELLENIYRWERENQQLKLSEPLMQQITRLLEEWKEEERYSHIKEIVRNEFHKKEDDIREQLHIYERKEQEITLELQEKEREKQQWETAKDPEPERKKEVIENRKKLQEKGIPYVPFYKVIDFEQGVSEQQIDRLEEALLCMGILDAIIVPIEYKEQILLLEEGTCDTYIFSDNTSTIKENLSQILHVEQEKEDIVFYQMIFQCLKRIGYQVEEHDTWIDQDGNYRLGVLQGTITKQYKAKYIGVKAREQFRIQKIEQLREECEQLQIQLQQIKGEIEQREQQYSCLRQEEKNLPSGEDVTIAIRSYQEKEHEYERIQKEIERKRLQLEDERKKLEEIRIQVQEICSKSYLKAQLPIFEQTLKHLNQYKNELNHLEILYINYQNGMVHIRGKEEDLEALDQDIDDILYELTQINRQLSKLKQMIQNTQEQLQLTDYNKIKERLDFCIKRLLEIPKEREEAVENRTKLKDSILNIEEKLKKNEEEKQNTILKKEQAKRVFLEEWKLHYIDSILEQEMELEEEEKARKIYKILEPNFYNKDQNTILGNLQSAFHQYKGNLGAYNLTMFNLFEEEEEKKTVDLVIKRLDIEAKYRGNSIAFNELIAKLEQDIEEQSRLLNEQDKDLFQEVLANTISKKIRAKIQSSKRWVERMNGMMESMRTSSGLRLSLRWKNRRAEKEEQLDTRALVELLQKDSDLMKPEEFEKLSKHFRSKIEEARKVSQERMDSQSFHMIMKEVLDYRKWFEFQLECQKTGEKKKELTDRVFFTFSGGEKAMAMYVPLFSAVAAKYEGARTDAPRLISLDEAFAGVDEMNIKDMFRLMIEFQFDFMLNSQILWGDYETVPDIAIYQLLRPENVKYVTVIPYRWNGVVRTRIEKKEEMS